MNGPQLLRQVIPLYPPALRTECMCQPSVSPVVSAGVWILMAKRSLAHDSMEYQNVVSLALIALCVFHGKFHNYVP